MYFSTLPHRSTFSFPALCKVSTIPCTLNILKLAFPFFWKNPVNNGGVRGGRVSQNSAGDGWCVHLQVGISERVEQIGCSSITSGAQCQTILKMQECECKESLFGDRTLPAVLLTSTCLRNQRRRGLYFLQKNALTIIVLFQLHTSSPTRQGYILCLVTLLHLLTFGAETPGT